jgi:putative MATE family efflux protein
MYLPRYMRGLKFVNMRNFTEGSIIKSLLYLAWPTVTANLLHTAYQLTDTFWVGRLGSTAMAAVSISFPVIFLIMSLGLGMAMAGSILAAQYKGKMEQGAVNHVATQALFTSAMIGITLSVVGYFISPWLVGLMGVESDVFTDAISYIKISFIGITFTFVYMTFQALLRGIGNVKTPMFIILGTVLINLLIDPLFIFGWKSFPAMGVSGAALATIITQGLSAMVGMAILFRDKSGIQLDKKDVKPDFPLILKMFKLGLPAAVEHSSRSLLMMAMMFLVAGFGTIVTAAYGVGNRIIGLAIIPTIGLSMATSTLVGQNMGAGKVERAEKTAKISVLVGFLALTILGLFSFLLAEPLVNIFIPGETETIQYGSLFLKFMAFAFGFICIQQVFAGAIRAAGSTFTSMMLTLVATWVILFPLAYFLSQHTSLAEKGIWLAFPITDVLSAAITSIWFFKGSWKKKRITEEIKVIEKIGQEAILEEGIN